MLYAAYALFGVGVLTTVVFPFFSALGSTDDKRVMALVPIYCYVGAAVAKFLA